MSRPSWDEYFMEITNLVSKRSTCLRRQIGALIVKDKRILATGYNGSPSGLAHCGEVGCLRDEMKIPSGERQELCRGLHAEQNAIIQAGLLGVSIKDSLLYCTHQPCILCAKMIVNAGIVKVIFKGAYPDKLARKILVEGKIKLERVSVRTNKCERATNAGESVSRPDECPPKADKTDARATRPRRVPRNGPEGK